MRALRRTLRRVKHVSPDMKETAADIFEHWARRTPDALALLFEDRAYSYRQYDSAANAYARWALDQGLRRGDCVALLMENRPDYLFAWLGMAKIGVITALMNTNLQGRGLAHSLNISAARHLILGAELAPVFATARELLDVPMTVWASDGIVPGAEDLDAALASMPRSPVGREAREDLRGSDICFYIYTSGTTGLPKAARFAHMRMHSGMHGFSGAVGATARDRMYNTLPLYHSAGGVAGVGIPFSVGGSMVLRRKFSATGFWDDCVRYRPSQFIYIGELCRYLLNAPPHPLEGAHGLRMACGNGLRPDIWTAFRERFAIPEIIEYYGSTEGNIALVNYDGRPGAVGRIAPYLARRFPVALVKFDVETEQPLRGPDGFCIPCATGETGEALGPISGEQGESFEGYQDPEATAQKILHDVFETGDAWFRSGDLLRRDKDGYYYFVDRVGDTFRWKGENVATSEVADVLSRFPGVKEANVYGVAVPGADGRAGMAAVVADDGIDLAGLRAHLAGALPAYALPLFLRLRRFIDVTGTFKHRKMELVAEGFDPGAIDDPLYFHDMTAERFVPLDAALFERICAGEIRL